VPEMAVGRVTAKPLNVRPRGCDIAQMFAGRVPFPGALNLPGGANLAHWLLGIDRNNTKGCRELNGVSVEEAQKKGKQA
jgi:hypothetical protein